MVVPGSGGAGGALPMGAAGSGRIYGKLEGVTVSQANAGPRWRRRSREGASSTNDVNSDCLASHNQFAMAAPAFIA